MARACGGISGARGSTGWECGGVSGLRGDRRSGSAVESPGCKGIDIVGDLDVVHVGSWIDGKDGDMDIV